MRRRLCNRGVSRVWSFLAAAILGTREYRSATGLETHTHAHTHLYPISDVLVGPPPVWPEEEPTPSHMALQSRNRELGKIVSCVGLRVA